MLHDSKTEDYCIIYIKWSERRHYNILLLFLLFVLTYCPSSYQHILLRNCLDSWEKTGEDCSFWTISELDSGSNRKFNMAAKDNNEIFVCTSFKNIFFGKFYITVILLKVSLNTITLLLYPSFLFFFFTLNHFKYNHQNLEQTS